MHENTKPVRRDTEIIVKALAVRRGMTTGMTQYQKIAVSLPSRAAETARRAVRQGRAASVSAYIASAIEEKAKLESLEALLDEMLAESGGPLTAAETRAADRTLANATRRGRGKRR